MGVPPKRKIPSNSTLNLSNAIQHRLPSKFLHKARDSQHHHRKATHRPHLQVIQNSQDHSLTTFVYRQAEDYREPLSVRKEEAEVLGSDGESIPFAR